MKEEDKKDEESLIQVSQEKYRVNLMIIKNNKEKEEVNIVEKLTVEKDKVSTVKELKYYIIDKYKKQKFCPCILSISVPFEDGFIYSIINDTADKNLEECFPDKNIYIIVDFNKKCDCGFNDLNQLTKREIYEIYSKKINELKKLLDNEKNEKNQKIKDLEEINKDILTNYDLNLENSINIKNTADSREKENKFNNTLKINENRNFFDPKFENFYDVIIDIKSLKDLNYGWEIKMSEKGEKKFNEYKNKKALIIGIIGNSNRGKSFLLSKISKILLPTGTSIRTEGLSIKYPELQIYKNRNIILLDSAGVETPLLLEKNDISYDKLNDKEKLNELVKEKAREKLMTELFLQNFIIFNSNILITVVGILTYSEQKLLNRIRIEATKTNKTIYIIHNLMTFTYIKQVQLYIQNYLLKDATFDLAERTEISTKKTKDNKQNNIPYYYEKIKNTKIFHLIFANEGSEAGNFYNNFALEFFEKAYQFVTDLKSFDVIQRLKERFLKLSKELIEKNENNLWISGNDFESNEIILKEKRFRLKNKKEINLKRCFIDELGLSNLRNNGFNPTYNYFEINNKLHIRIEAPGNIDNKISYDIFYSGNLTIIEIKGKKMKDIIPEDINDNVINTREYGEFSIQIPLIKNLSHKEPNITIKKGLILIEYELENYDNKISCEFKSNDDDEI